MEQGNQDAAQKFKEVNGMSIEEAYGHVKEWHEAGQYANVIDGCEEIMRYDQNYQDIQTIIADAKNKQTAPEKIKTESTPTSSEPVETIETAAQQTTEEISEEQQNKIKDDFSVEKDPNEPKEPKVTTDEKALAAIGYIGFLAILPLLMKKSSDYCQFHGKQGLVLAIIFFLYKYLAILDFLPVVGTVIAIILHFGLAIELCIIIFAIIRASTGARWKIPGIYAMSQKFKF